MHPCHMTPDALLEWRPPHPTNLRETIGGLRRGPSDPTQREAPARAGERAAIWRTLRAPEGTASIRVAELDDGSLRCEGWGEGAAVAVAAAPELLGARDDARAFEPHLEGVRVTHRRHPGMRIPRTGYVFDALVPAILEQKVIVGQAQDAWRRLVCAYGDEAPGPVDARMRVAPAAATWQRLPSWAWHRAGVDPQRSRTIVRCAGRAAAIDRLAALPSTEARARLQSLPGIGVWTSAEVAQRALGDPDAVSVGDYHLAKHIGYALRGRDMTDAEMLEALEPWAGQRYRAVKLILMSGPRRPRRGAKLAYVDHRGY